MAEVALAQITKVTTFYVSDSAGVLPLWIAKDAGIFARNGLDVQIVRAHASVAVMALLSGELQFVLASGPVVIESALRGSNAVYVAGGMATLDFMLMSRPEIKTAGQLKGTTVGLSALRGANPTATRFALEKLGLTSKEVPFIVLGARVLVQTGEARDSQFPDVPTIYELMNEHKTPEKDRELLRMILAATDFGRPIIAPPGVPADKTKILHEA